MIISRTPLRISFFGGGTDYPLWYREYGGAVLATTISRYTYLSVRYLPPFFQHKTKVVWSKIECVDDHEQIQHPAAREALKFLGINRGVEIYHNGDLPARSGLGSSSAFTVGLLHALYALRGVVPEKMRLARDAIHIEQEMIQECVGSQDQTMAAFGGIHRVAFAKNGEIALAPLVCDANRISSLQSHLMLIFTGLSRNAFDVAKTHVETLQKNCTALKRMYEMVNEAVAILTSNVPITAFGELLSESWQLKRNLTPAISNPFIDDLISTAHNAGAVGAKLLGAGGGGFLLLFARPEDQPRIRKAFSRLLHVPFAFETTGSQIIFSAQGDEDLNL